MNFFLLTVLQAFWLLLPSAVANIIPVLVKHINFLNIPVDFGYKLWSHPLFGAHKTFRGFFFGILSAMAIILLQRMIESITSVHGMLDYTALSLSSLLFLGFFLGFGALIGDVIESFIKRRLVIKPGAPFFPFDQIDWILGSLFFVSFVVQLNLLLILIALVLYGFLHPLANLLGYYLKIKKNKF